MKSNMDTRSIILYGMVLVLVGKIFWFFNSRNYKKRKLLTDAVPILNSNGSLYSFYKSRFLYIVTLYKKIFDHNYRTYAWWNEIIDGIILGAIPLKNYKHDDILVNLDNVGYVLTILDNFEIETVTFVSQPVQPQDWIDKNVSQKIINSSDFGPLKVQDIVDGVNFLETCVDRIKQSRSNKKIYVHCKAGHGRSVTIVVAYLIKRHNMSARDAYNHVKKIRHTVNLNKYQFDSLAGFCEKMNIIN